MTIKLRVGRSNIKKGELVGLSKLGYLKAIKPKADGTVSEVVLAVAADFLPRGEIALIVGSRAYATKQKARK